MSKIKLQIPEKLLPFVTKPKRFKVAIGGRGGGKSQSFAGMLLMASQTQGLKVGCFREYQNSIEDSVHALLTGEIDRLGAPGFSAVKTHIDNTSGGCFRFRGLSRSPDAVKSMYGFHRFWIEEAQSISETSLRLLTPTLREAGAEAWFSLNPMSSADPISQRFIEPFKHALDKDGYYEDDLHLIVKINYMDNPWFPEDLERERLFDYNRLTRAEYDHVWLGEYNDTVEGSIIPAEWFDAAVDAHIKLGFEPIGQKVLAHDPSDEGKDDKAVVIRHGSVFTHAETLSTGDCADGMDWALNMAVKEQVDLFTWDCDGIGLGLKRQVKQALDGKKIDWVMFKGSEAAERPDEIYEGTGDSNHDRTNKQTFRNNRAQKYWSLRDRFFNTYQAIEKGKYIDPDQLISVSSAINEIVKFKSEVCRVPKKYNSNGLIQIMDKPSMARLKINSPNIADSAMMSQVTTQKDELPNWGPMDLNTKWVV